MNNSVFNAEVNEATAKANLELAQKNLEVGSASLKALMKILDVLTGIKSPGDLGKSANFAWLINPRADAVITAGQAKIQQAKAMKDLTNIKQPIQQPDLAKTNPIQFYTKLEEVK